MIADMLKKENVQIVDSVNDWKEAVRISIQPLADGGFVEPRYAEGIIDNTVSFGPYYVLAADVALIHGRPEQGVIKKQLAVTVLRRPIAFAGDGSHQARLLVALAATDGEAHIDVMRVLAELFMDSGKVKQIIESDSVEQIYEMFLDAGHSAAE